jgi:quercetin dioxygenase-like cupin family protein
MFSGGMEETLLVRFIKGKRMMERIQILPASKRGKMEAQWGGLTWNASAALGNTKELTIGQCLLLPGQRNPSHSHPNCEEVLVVMQGEISHTIEDGKEVTLKEGDTITIPKNIPHQAHNIGDIDAILYIAFSSANRETQGE